MGIIENDAIGFKTEPEVSGSKTAGCSTAITLHHIIMQGICEMDEADPEKERTVCVNYDDLYQMIEDRVMQNASR